MPPGDLLWLAPIFFLGLAGLLLGWTEIGSGSRTANHGLTLAPWRRFLMILSWFLVPIGAIYLFSLRQPIFTDRYIIWIAPAAMLLFALGVQVVVRNAGTLGKPLGALLVCYLLGFWLYAGWQQKSLPMKYNLRDAVSYVHGTRTPDALLILQIPHMEYGYRYYSREGHTQPFADSESRLAPWQPGLWTNNGHPDEETRSDVDRHMRAITADHAEVWLLRSEVEMWDQRRLMDEWLEEHGEVVDQADFHGVQVRHYRLNPP
ncbi:MAG: hypothetical protein HC802_03355 [Caldilineaceae bacterium]|nr:hypothetical protein [Caldilineaceae bacterium]